jgi:serine/threonine-protein kinase
MGSFSVMHLLFRPTQTDLDKLLRATPDGELNGATARGVVGQLLCGLARLSEIGVLHRDLKPANVLLDEDAQCPGGFAVRICDFGFARFSGTQQVNKRLAG